MNPDLLDILTTELGNPKKHSHGEYYFHCPFCIGSDKHLAVNMNKGKWQCWKCSTSGSNLLSLFRRLRLPKNVYNKVRKILSDVSYHSSPEELEDIIDVQLPEEFLPLWEPTNLVGYKSATKYLFGRGLTPRDLLRYSLGYCLTGPYAGRIIIPSYDASGELNFFTGRDFYGDSQLKYKNPPVSKNIVGFESQINYKYPIVLCEGPMDAMAIKTNAIPLFGKNIPPKLKQTIIDREVQTIYVALDTDAAKKACQIIQTYLREGQEVYRVNLQGKDPSDIGFSQMQDNIKHATKMNFKNLIEMKLHA